MAPGYFVTGTDTNVGKTFVTSALARRATELGHKVFAFKPIETGCMLGPEGHYLGADQEQLARAAGDWQRDDLRGLYRYPLPAAPSVAAAAATSSIDLGLVVATARRGPEFGASFTLVEGAGGWRVPITDAADMSNLARDLDLPVLVVARAGLGTINHTLLTIEAIQRDGLRLAAVVLSQHPDEPRPDSNREQILRRWPGRVLILSSDPSVLEVLLPSP
ncbi:MAG TPA: dethiobiotin synthase [Kofleriaceae bacterium]|jgi:dethiobiotin synthetase|nr:dethiobiotin synthase [Kofleriaceae bacterium]